MSRKFLKNGLENHQAVATPAETINGVSKEDKPITNGKGEREPLESFYVFHTVMRATMSVLASSKEEAEEIAEEQFMGVGWVPEDLRWNDNLGTSLVMLESPKDIKPVLFAVDDYLGNGEVKRNTVRLPLNQSFCMLGTLSPSQFREEMGDYEEMGD